MITPTWLQKSCWKNEQKENQEEYTYTCSWLFCRTNNIEVYVCVPVNNLVMLKKYKNKKKQILTEMLNLNTQKSHSSLVYGHEIEEFLSWILFQDVCSVIFWEKAQQSSESKTFIFTSETIYKMLKAHMQQRLLSTKLYAYFVMPLLIVLDL